MEPVHRTFLHRAVLSSQCHVFELAWRRSPQIGVSSLSVRCSDRWGIVFMNSDSLKGSEKMRIRFKSLVSRRRFYKVDLDSLTGLASPRLTVEA